MTMTRYQIRNEYGLADKELYQAANKEDPEALLEGASMAGLVGVLRQLGDLAEFAAEVFHCLHEELMTTAARGHGLAMRLQQLEAEFPSTEIPILSQTDHSTFYYDPGFEWHPNLQTEENLIAPRNLPHCLMDSYEECRAPPQLFLLDKFNVAGSGSCLKRYSDPSLLKKPTASALVATSKLSKDEKTRKPKKESHTTSKETPGDSRTSHAKLHQLFILEHVENGLRNPEFHVKLKRRQLNGPPINSSSGTGYMEKFLKNSSPYCERVHGTLEQSSPAMETEVTVCSVREDLPLPSLLYPNSENIRITNEMEMKPIADNERLEIPFLPHAITVIEKSLPNTEEGAAVCLERSSSVTLCCKANNDTDAPASTNSEATEVDSDDKPGCDLGFPGFGQTQICSNAEVTQTEVLAQFSNVLHHSPEEGESNLLCTDIQRSSPESKPYKAEGSAVKADDHSQHFLSVETESEISLSALVEDQFSSITDQETEAMKPKDISSEAGQSIPDSKSSLEETPAALESDFLLPNQYISIFDNLEGSSLPADTQDNAVPKEYETNSQDGSSMNPEQSGHISTSEISSENGTLMSDTPRDLHSGSGNLTASSCGEDTLANPDLDEMSSNSGQEDPQTMSIVADDSSELGIPIPDTHSHGTCFAGDVDHDKQTGLNNKASETVPNIDLENISDPQESLLGAQDCLSPEYCIQTQDQGQESSSETGSAHPVTASAESLSRQDGPAGVHCSPSEETLTCNEKIFPSSISEIEALHAPHQETFTSLNDHISESVLPMDLIDEKDCLEVSPESMVPCPTSIYKTPQADPEITPELPPLPPTQWWMGKLVESTERSSLFTGSGNNNICIHRDDNTHNGSVQETAAQYPSEASVTDGENHNSHDYTEDAGVEAVSTCAQTTLEEPSKATEEQSSSAVNGTSDTYMQSTPKCLSKTAEESFALEESTQGIDDWRTEAMALEWFSQNLREHINPNPAKLEEEQPQVDHPVEQPGETKFPQTLRDNNSNDHNQKAGQLRRDKDSLVIGIDKSMLRKVSERNKTQVGAGVDENGSLLEIIRSKSFNLRPADTSARPNFQVAVPKTNLKVAAILEKANTLRQAMAGSDDEHDSDSWSE